MCGIAGIVQFEGGDQDERHGRLKAMTRIIAHRGPDGEGFFEDSRASLGHRRLAIIDLESGDQPMSTDDARFHIIFNGELYNYRELRLILEKKGHIFHTQSDTEVVMQGFSEWGERCVDRFNGMFALAIWDAQACRLFLARDRLGKKPLYYLRNGRTVAFASELKSLLASGLADTAIDPKSLMDYLSFGYIPAPRTIYSSIKKLQAAHIRLDTMDDSVEERYWTPSFGSVRERTDAEMLEELTELFDDAVRCRLISDVPLGAFLSGGIDSSLVVSSMAALSDGKVKTHTIATDDPDYNEAEIAREIANYLGTEHHEFVVAPDAESSLEKIAWHLDEPFADPSVLPSWYVCKMTRQSVTVALSGDGGDEGFGGYTFRYLPHRFESRVRRIIPPALRAVLFGPLGSIWPGSASLPKALRLKSIFSNLAVGDAEAFYRDLLVMNERDLMRTLQPEFRRRLMGYDGFELVGDYYQGNDAQECLGRAQFADMKFYMTDDVLVKVDRMSMAHGLEVRAPLLDYRIIEFAASLPPDAKMSLTKGKLPLRALAAQRLPETVLSQPKRGFTIPTSSWLRKELRDLCADNLFNGSGIISEVLDPLMLRNHWDAHQSGSRDNSAFLWSLMMLGLWEHQYSAYQPRAAA